LRSTAFVALLGALTLAASALAQTGDSVACYKLKGSGQE